MTKDQGGGIAERLIYGAILFVAMKFVQAGYIDADMAAYIAAGGVAACGSAYAWWHNRPVSVLNRAAEAMPGSAKLVISTAADAPQVEKIEARALADAASDKVIAKTS